MPELSQTLAAPHDDLALGFVNTRFWRGREAPTETLHGPADLAAWCAAEAGVTAEALDEGTFAAALALRECLARIFAAHAGGGVPAAGDIAAFNAALAAAPGRARLVADATGLRWGVPAGSGWQSARAALLWSAADLLTGPRRERVRQCDNPECRYLFLDASKAGTRRWCDMASCGNRAKAHRHHQRRKAGRVS
jgi:predicted RNA-binding Zn ribbon-like protein